MPRLRENISLNFEYKNEATRDNLQGEKILKGRSFWNRVDCELLFVRSVEFITHLRELTTREDTF